VDTDVLTARAGPLLAVCGVCGGAGATTVAYLVALAASQHSAAEPVLVCDTGGPSGGLATYARAESPRSLCGVANAVAAYEPLAEGLFADAGPGLRVLATRPQLGAEGDARGVARVLHDARGTHALTVVDCGALHGTLVLQVLDAATHVAWVLPATAAGARQGVRVLSLFGVEATRREIVIARHQPAERNAPFKQLAALAATRNAPLVLMPAVANAGERPAEEALDEARVSVDAIEAVIGR
jgi:Flp pilus assembly CpaE family ATPase